MARAMSVDLRQLVEATDGGLTMCEAARQFAIDVATAGAQRSLPPRGDTAGPMP